MTSLKSILHDFAKQRGLEKEINDLIDEINGKGVRPFDPPIDPVLVDMAVVAHAKVEFEVEVRIDVEEMDPRTDLAGLEMLDFKEDLESLLEEYFQGAGKGSDNREIKDRVDVHGMEVRIINARVDV